MFASQGNTKYYIFRRCSVFLMCKQSIDRINMKEKNDGLSKLCNPVSFNVTPLTDCMKKKNVFMSTTLNY